jgi:hypothetical protein
MTTQENEIRDWTLLIFTVSSVVLGYLSVCILAVLMDWQPWQAVGLVVGNPIGAAVGIVLLKFKLMKKPRK